MRALKQGSQCPEAAEAEKRYSPVELAMHPTVKPVARAIEIDPAYADVAIKRWQRLTSAMAVHGTSGKSFAEIAQTPSMRGGRPRLGDAARSQRQRR
jgi:hypothetical protein